MPHGLFCCQGIASFDEIFLHYCSTDVRSILKNFTIWVSLVDAADCDLGTFHVDLSELAMVENLNSNFGGKSMSFVLGGMASGGALNLSVYCRMLEEAQDNIVGTLVASLGLSSFICSDIMHALLKLL